MPATSFPHAREAASTPVSSIMHQRIQDEAKLEKKIAEFWKQTSMDKDEKIYRLEEQIKKLQEAEQEIQMQAVEAVKDARAKQLEAQVLAKSIYEENEKLQKLNKHCRKCNELNRKTSEHMKLEYQKLKKEKLALMEANGKMKVQLEQAGDKMTTDNDTSSKLQLLATHAGRLADGEPKHHEQ